MKNNQARLNEAGLVILGKRMDSIWFHLQLLMVIVYKAVCYN